MNLGYACGVFAHLESEDIPISEKLEAIRIVSGMETVNGLKKAHFVNAVKLLVNEIDWGEE